MFWPDFLDKWFKVWPIPEPAPEFAEGEVDMQNAMKGEHAKRVAVSIIYPLTGQPGLTVRTATEACVQKCIG